MVELDPNDPAKRFRLTRKEAVEFVIKTLAEQADKLCTAEVYDLLRKAISYKAHNECHIGLKEKDIIEVTIYNPKKNGFV